VVEGRLDCGLSEGDMLLLSPLFPNCPRNTTRNADATINTHRKFVMHLIPFVVDLFLLILEYMFIFVVLEF
jgi:hypothetical protein